MPDKMFKTNHHVQSIEWLIYKLSKIFQKQFLLENLLELIEEVYEPKEKINVQ